MAGFGQHLIIKYINISATKGINHTFGIDKD